MKQIIAVAAVVGLAPVAQAQTVFDCNLDGAQANGGAGTGSSFTGSGTVTLNAAEDQITVAITHDVTSPTAAHIHEGVVGGSRAVSCFPSRARQAPSAIPLPSARGRS